MARFEEAPPPWDERMEKMREKLDDARERIADVADQTMEKGERLYKRSRKYVQKQPLRLLAGTFVVGLLLGLLLRRDSD